MLFDRLMFRHKGQEPSEETWHRDVIPTQNIYPDDEVYGGWLNLDEKPQYFSCILGSHLGVKLSTLKEGFAKIPPELVGTLKPYATKVKILPGHLIIFPQYILHEVLNAKAEHNMMRLFTGWRLTLSKKFIHPDTRQRMVTQSIMQLPSAQEPPMYSRTHLNQWQTKEFRPVKPGPKTSLVKWSHDSFPPEFLKKSKTKNYTLLPRFLQSLQYYKLPLYEPYTEDEIDLYLPQKIV